MSIADIHSNKRRRMTHCVLNQTSHQTQILTVFPSLLASRAKIELQTTPAHIHRFQTTMDQLQLPDGYRPLETQVAGHTFTATDADALGMLQDATYGCVLKPLGKPSCAERELGFYESLQSSNADPRLAQLRQFVPEFHHSVKLIVNNREHMFLKLADITHGMAQPCIMDVKIGQRTWDPLATPQKRAVEETKYVRCKQALGLCLPGFQVYTSDGQMLRHGKDYGKQLDVAGFRATMALFLNAKPTPCTMLLREILSQLRNIRAWFCTQTLLHFYASSLLITYDYQVLQRQRQQAHSTNDEKCNSKGINGNVQNGDVNSSESDAEVSTSTSSASTCEQRNSEGGAPITDLLNAEPEQWVRVKMIDFAHVFPAECGTCDKNYLFGLQNLIAIIEDLLLDV